MDSSSQAAVKYDILLSINSYKSNIIETITKTSRKTSKNPTSLLTMLQPRTKTRISSTCPIINRLQIKIASESRSKALFQLLVSLSFLVVLLSAPDHKATAVCGLLNVLSC